MDRKLFADSLFVSYGSGTPSAERIPYVCGTALTQEILQRLTTQIRSGCVRSVQLDDEERENSLIADFRSGWATVYIVKDVEHYYELVNDQFPNCGTQLTITGDGPTPQRHATQDMALMSEIIAHFAQTGGVYPACTWEHTVH